jgi:hypothetical protein
VKPVSLLNHRIKRLEFSYSVLYFHGGFLNTPVSCSVKCVRGLELPFDLFLGTVVSHLTLLVSIVVFRCVFVVPNLVLKTGRFSITMRSWPS